MKRRTCIGARGKACPRRMDLSLAHGNRRRCQDCAKAEIYRHWHARHLETVKAKNARHNRGLRKSTA